MGKLAGRKFAWLRAEGGLTKWDSKVAAQFSRRYLSALERGEQNPKIITIYELAKALGVSHVDLVMSDAMK